MLEEVKMAFTLSFPLDKTCDGKRMADFGMS